MKCFSISLLVIFRIASAMSGEPSVFAIHKDAARSPYYVWEGRGSVLSLCWNSNGDVLQWHTEKSLYIWNKNSLSLTCIPCTSTAVPYAVQEECENFCCELFKALRKQQEPLRLYNKDRAFSVILTADQCSLIHESTQSNIPFEQFLSTGTHQPLAIKRACWNPNDTRIIAVSGRNKQNSYVILVNTVPLLSTNRFTQQSECCEEIELIISPEIEP